jgi:cytochrome c553
MLACAPLAAAADAKPAESAQLCLLCHKPANRFVPLLERQPREFLVLALTAYKTGKRSQTSMTINAASLTASDIEALSAYFAAQAFPDRRQDLDAVKVAAGKALVSGSDCAQCHGSAFRGGGATPGLAGLTYGYLVIRLGEFRSSGRGHPSPLPVLKDEADIERAASYLASLR